MKSLENGLQLHFGVTPLFPMKIVLLMSSQYTYAAYYEAEPISEILSSYVTEEFYLPVVYCTVGTY